MKRGLRTLGLLAMIFGVMWLIVALIVLMQGYSLGAAAAFMVIGVGILAILVAFFAVIVGYYLTKENPSCLSRNICQGPRRSPP